MMNTIMGFMKRGDLGYDQVSTAYPNGLTDLANMIRLHKRRYQLYVIPELDAFIADGSLELAHLFPFKLGGSLAEDNIRILEATANRSYRDAHSRKRATYEVEPLTDKKTFHRQAEAHFTPDWWLDLMFLLLGDKANDDKAVRTYFKSFNAETKSLKNQRITLAEKFPQHAESILKTHPTVSKNGRIFETYVLSDRQVRTLILGYQETRDYWLLVSLDFISTDDQQYRQVQLPIEFRNEIRDYAHTTTGDITLAFAHRPELITALHHAESAYNARILAAQQEAEAQLLADEYNARYWNTLNANPFGGTPSPWAHLDQDALAYRRELAAQQQSSDLEIARHKLEAQWAANDLSECPFE